MGGYSAPCSRTHFSTIDERKSVPSNEVHTTLRNHPKVRFNKPPKRMTPQAIVEYTLDCVAKYMSPTKIDAEDFDFRCKDVADAIKTKLKDELIELIEWEIVKQNLGVKR